MSSPPSAGSIQASMNKEARVSATQPGSSHEPLAEVLVVGPQEFDNVARTQNRKPLLCCPVATFSSIRPART